MIFQSIIFFPQNVSKYIKSMHRASPWVLQKLCANAKFPTLCCQGLHLIKDPNYFRINFDLSFFHRIKSFKIRKLCNWDSASKNPVKTSFFGVSPLWYKV